MYTNYILFKEVVMTDLRNYKFYRTIYMPEICHKIWK